MKSRFIVKSENLHARFKREVQRAGRNPAVSIGYSAPYALAVHERVPIVQGVPTPVPKDRVRAGVPDIWSRPRWRAYPNMPAVIKGAWWDPVNKGRPHFLVMPLRVGRKKWVKMIIEDYTRGFSSKGTHQAAAGKFIDALYKAGKAILERSKQYVPVHTGKLISTGYVIRET